MVEKLIQKKLNKIGSHRNTAQGKNSVSQERIKKPPQKREPSELVKTKHCIPVFGR